MTEFEINKAVAEKLGLEFKCSKSLGYVTVHGTTFNPCSNVEQAWEIMMDNEISVTPSGDGKYFAFRAISFGYGAMDYYKDEVATHEKPLVSAMLCFLEIDK